MEITDEDQIAFQKYTSGNFEDAMYFYNNLLEKDPKNTEYLATRAQCHFNLSNFQMCLDDVKCLMSLDTTNHIEALITGGRAATKLEKYEEAYYCYTAGLKIVPKHKEIIEDLKELQKIIIKDVESKAAAYEEKGYNAVDFCGQDPYPGDVDLFQMEVEILEKKFKIKTESFDQKPFDDVIQQKVASAAMAGHNCMLQRKWKEAQKCFTVALELDPNNHVVRRLRAEASNNMEEMTATFQDLWLIPKLKRTPDTWKLGGKILMKFELLVLAEFWFRKATQATSGKDNETKVLFQKCRVKRLYGPLTSDFPIRVDFTEYGRAIYATEDIPAGEIVFSDAPIVLGKVFDTVHYKTSIQSCDHCAQSLLSPQEYFKETFSTMDSDLRELVLKYWPNTKPIYCKKCKTVKYCSDECKTQAWNTYHELICPSRSKATARLYKISENFGKEADETGNMVEVWVGHFSPLILARIWATIATTAKSMARESGGIIPTKEQWAYAKGPYRKFIAYGNISVEKDQNVMKDLFREIFADCGDGVSYDITDSEFKGRYFQAVCNLQVFSSPWTPYHKFLDELGKAEEDEDCTLRLLKYLKDKPTPSNVCGMFPLHACLNHSCLNNVEVSDGVVHGKGGVTVRSKRDIQKGEEIFTTYIDTAMPRKLRRAWLYKSFNFWCRCPRCQVEGDDPNVCTRCGKKAQEGKKFPGCGKCMKAWYCSVTCQKSAWKLGHKVACKTEHSKTSYG